MSVKAFRDSLELKAKPREHFPHDPIAALGMRRNPAGFGLDEQIVIDRPDRSPGQATIAGKSDFNIRAIPIVENSATTENSGAFRTDGHIGLAYEITDLFRDPRRDPVMLIENQLQ